MYCSYFLYHSYCPYLFDKYIIYSYFISVNSFFTRYCNKSVHRTRFRLYIALVGHTFAVSDAYYNTPKKRHRNTVPMSRKYFFQLLPRSQTYFSHILVTVQPLRRMAELLHILYSIVIVHVFSCVFPASRLVISACCVSSSTIPSRDGNALHGSTHTYGASQPYFCQNPI